MRYFSVSGESAASGVGAMNETVFSVTWYRCTWPEVESSGVNVKLVIARPLPLLSLPVRTTSAPERTVTDPSESGS